MPVNAHYVRRQWPARLDARCVRGFTLVELLVVIAIIGVLVALLLPAVQAAREAARRNQCLSNLRQMSLGLINYETANGQFPPAFEYDKNANPAILSVNQIGPNWLVRILPMVEQAPLYNRIDKTFTVAGTKDPLIGHANNASVREASVASFLCPSDSYNRTPLQWTGTTWARGNYAANAGNGSLLKGYPHSLDGPSSPGWLDHKRRGAIGPNVSVRLKEITDGTSNTILLGEVRAGITESDKRGTWALGQAGASGLYWYGSTGDANGPNVCDAFSDDVGGPKKDIDDALMVAECMPDWTGDEWNNQATTRSMHTGGVNLGMADGSAHFISTDIQTGGPYHDWGVNGAKMTVWDMLIASADDQVIQDMPF
jgi:prepilin-type N-terminal cleavage/methylation domain-containing protein/prepilin-type processing-associated H-X9-DG protein